MNRSSAALTASGFSRRRILTTLRLSGLAVALLLALISAACAPGEGESQPALLVGVAASVQPVAAELAARFESEHGTAVTLVTGSSGTLAEQLRQGAPLDVLISADSRYTSALATEGSLDPAGVTALATGELVAITGLDDSEEDVSALLRGRAVRQIALANPDLAPYGDAARRYLEDRGLWDGVAERAVYGENVAQAFQFVASGNAELGFVSRSLVIASDARNVRVLAPLPPEASAGLQVTAGISLDSDRAETARLFIASMSDPRALEVWQGFGYTPHIGKVDGAE